MTKLQPSEPLVFRDKSIRRIWHENEWFFSIVDICGVLTDTPLSNSKEVLEQACTKAQKRGK